MKRYHRKSSREMFHKVLPYINRTLSIHIDLEQSGRISTRWGKQYVVVKIVGVVTAVSIGYGEQWVKRPAVRIDSYPLPYDLERS